ncbi:MAG: SRPBCC family protein [Nitriliruptorales bacterium]
MTERASHDTLIEAPPDAIMAVITDFEAYPEWAANIRDAEIRESDEAGRPKLVWYDVDARIMDLRYVLDYSYHGTNRLTWTLSEGAEIDKLEGEYRLEEEEGGTRVHYTLEIDVAFPLPGFLKKRATKRIIDTSLGDLRERVESRAA